jgi:alkanesulfonate monooxygenase SsuD/methylene tetrahydromethanopterin reductase-like flavin-dependent oxidoreductase (luciferase family)
MTDFDHRWQTTTAQARRVTEQDEEVPAGFATRVLARHHAMPAEPWLDLLTTLGLRAVLTSAIVFAASATLAFWQLDPTALTPDWVAAPLSPKLLLP